MLAIQKIILGSIEAWRPIESTGVLPLVWEAEVNIKRTGMFIYSVEKKIPEKNWEWF